MFFGRFVYLDIFILLLQNRYSGLLQLKENCILHAHLKQCNDNTSLKLLEDPDRRR